VGFMPSMASESILWYAVFTLLMSLMCFLRSSAAIGGRMVRMSGACAAALSAIALFGAERPPVAYQPMGVANGCFVESVACFDAYHETEGADAWVRVLQWGAREDEVMVAGHAVTILESSNRLWCWDVNHGWFPLGVPPESREDAAAVSGPVIARYPRIVAIYPVLWDDAGQSREAPAATARAAEASTDRDAGLAADRLGRHRPVNRVAFNIPADGGDRRSEAVVFVFGGRMCVYSPDQGTFLFRARSTVWNVRLVQEMLRRMYPGAQNVRSLAAGSTDGR